MFPFIIILYIFRNYRKMSSDVITLVNSAEMVAQINSEKVLVAVPLLYTFMVPL